MDNNELGFSILDFWAWNGSDLLNNTLRGALAEFIVAKALGIQINTAREDWTEYDLTYPYEGCAIPIEVKSSAYLQAWPQNKPSNINFNIAPSRAWANQRYAEPYERHAAIYIFCLYTLRDMSKKSAVNVLRLDQWLFMVLETERINMALALQRSVSYASLLSLSPICCPYSRIKDSVSEVLVRSKGSPRKLQPPG